MHSACFRMHFVCPKVPFSSRVLRFRALLLLLVASGLQDGPESLFPKVFLLFGDFGTLLGAPARNSGRTLSISSLSLYCLKSESGRISSGCKPGVSNPGGGGGVRASFCDRQKGFCGRHRWCFATAIGGFAIATGGPTRQGRARQIWQVPGRFGRFGRYSKDRDSEPLSKFEILNRFPGLRF